MGCFHQTKLVTVEEAPKTPKIFAAFPATTQQGLIQRWGSRDDSRLSFEFAESAKRLAATHVGSYESLMSTYEQVIDGPLRYDGWTLLAQPIIEIYRDSPAEVGEDDLRTDLYFPVAKLS